MSCEQFYRKCPECGTSVHMNFKCRCGGNPWNVAEPKHQGETLYRFVKASERLPEDEVRAFIISGLGERNVAWYNTADKKWRWCGDDTEEMQESSVNGLVWLEALPQSPSTLKEEGKDELMESLLESVPLITVDGKDWLEYTGLVKLLSSFPCPSPVDTEVVELPDGYDDWQELKDDFEKNFKRTMEIINERDRWKKRCEAAEEFAEQMAESLSFKKRNVSYIRWQSLKSQSHNEKEEK